MAPSSTSCTVIDIAGRVLSALGLAALAGGMVFFGAVMAPLVFSKLPPEFSGPFIRAIFPRYYAFVTASALFGGLGFFLRGRRLSAVALGLVAAATLWAWLGLIPHLNALRDAGHMAAFDRGHELATWLNGAELMMTMWLLVREALRGRTLTARS